MTRPASQMAQCSRLNIYVYSNRTGGLLANTVNDDLFSYDCDFKCIIVGLGRCEIVTIWYVVFLMLVQTKSQSNRELGKSHRIYRNYNARDAGHLMAGPQYVHSILF